MIVGLYLPILTIDTNNSKFEYLEGNCKISCIILFYFFLVGNLIYSSSFLIKFFNELLNKILKAPTDIRDNVLDAFGRVNY